MSKEKEEIKMLVVTHFGALGFFNPRMNNEILKDRDKVLKFIDRLEAIETSNPSEALEALKKISEIYGATNSLEGTYEYFLTIKQALIQKSKKEQAWEIAKKVSLAGDNLSQIITFETYEDYICWSWNCELTEDEFELLKESVGE